MAEQDNRRYPGARPFLDTNFDRMLFKGRKEELQQLLHLVLAEKLVVIFSKSGVGKSSLLNAGIFQPLRDKDYFPIRIRMNNPDSNFIDEIDSEAKLAAKNYNIDLTSGDKDSLWHYFKSAEFWSEKDILLTPVLIFDQFEEIFTLGFTAEQRKQFFLQLADLVLGRIPESYEKTKAQEEKLYSEKPPNIKVVISMREDFLAQLEEMATDIPSILRNRFRLKALTLEQAREAIEEPARVVFEDLAAKNFSYESKAVESILNFLTRKDSQTDASYGLKRKFWPWKYVGMLLIWLSISSPVIVEGSEVLSGLLLLTNFFVIIISCSILAYFRPIKFINASLTTLALYLFFLFLCIFIGGFLTKFVFDSETIILLGVVLGISLIPGLVSWRRLKTIVKPRTDLGSLVPKEIEPFQLQLLCQYIEEKVIEEQKSSISPEKEIIVNEEDFGGEEGMDRILQTFYSNQIKRVQTKYRRVVRKLCEKGLISPTGRRLSLAEEIIADKYRIPIKVLGNLIDYRLLRAEPKLNTYYYELSHDTMIKPIFETAKSRQRKRITWSVFIIFVLAIPLIGYILIQNKKELIQNRKEMTELEFMTNFSRLDNEVYQFLLASDNLLRSDRATIYNKIDGLRNNTQLADLKIRSLDSLNLLYPEISKSLDYARQIDLNRTRNQFFKDTLASLESFALQSTHSEKEELIVKNEFDANYSYLRNIGKNAEDILNNNLTTLNEKIDGLKEYQVVTETKLRLLDNLIQTYPSVAQKNKYNNSYLEIKENYDRLSTRFNELKRISNEYATISNPNNLVACTNIRGLRPYNVSTYFQPGKIYIWANINSPKEELLRLEWVDTKGNVFQNYRVKTEISNNYRIYYYQNIDVAGNYEVRVYNSQNYLIGRRGFEIAPDVRQMKK